MVTSKLAHDVIRTLGAALPNGAIAEGYTLTVPVWNGSSPASLRLLLSESGLAFSVEADTTDIVRDIFDLARVDDIEFLLDRYGVSLDRDEAGDRHLLVSDHRPEVFAWRVYAVIQFVQAALDYQTGLESAQYQAVARG